MQNTNQIYPIDEHLIGPKTLWYSYGFNVDAYYGDNITFIGSLGFRSFNYGLGVDTVLVTYLDTPSGIYISDYGNQEQLFGYYLPTIGVGLELPLKEDLSLRNHISFGYRSFMQKIRKRSTAFEGYDQEQIDKLDGGLKETHCSRYLEKEVFDVKISSTVSYNILNLSIFGGLSYYYFSSSNIQYGGLHVDVGVAYKFLKP